MTKKSDTETQEAQEKLVHANVHEALAYIQQNLKVGKSKWNKFSEFSYRTLEDINEAIKPLLGNSIFKYYDDVVIVGDKVMIKSTARLQLGFDFEETVGFAWLGEKKPKMDEGQTTGSATTYARKIAAGGLFLLDDNFDPDSEGVAAEVIENSDITSTQIKELEELIARKGADSENIKKAFNVKKLSGLKKSQFADVKKILEGRPDANK